MEQEEINKEMEAHELTSMFPAMTDKEYEALCQDIERNGLQEPIWTYEGKIIDGWHRYQACIKVKVPPQFQEWDGDGSLEDFVFSQNYYRRHLDSNQRAVLALPIVKKRAAEAKANMRTGGRGRRKAGAKKGSEKILKPINSAVEAAKVTGTNSRYVNAAKRVEENAPELLPQVMNRKLTVLQGAALSALPAEERGAIMEKINTGAAKDFDEALRMVKADKRAALAEAVSDRTDQYFLFQKAVEHITAEDIADESICAIVTDAPYKKKYLYVYEHLAKLAARVLKPGGNLLVMCGHGYLPEIYAAMGSVAELTYRWTSTYLMPGAPTMVEHFKVRSGAKPVIWYVKGDKFDNNWPLDVHISDAREKEFHPWGQSRSGMLSILREHCLPGPGTTIYDPFVGGGTTAVAALELNMYFIGSDIDEQCIKDTKARIAVDESCELPLAA